MYGEQRWVGLLGDTVDSCTVAVVTEACLGFKRLGLAWASDCQYCQGSSKGSHEGRSQTSEQQKMQFSILETAVAVNKDATVPKGLVLDETKARWEYTKLTRGGVFDLGESGRLSMLCLFHHSRGVLMKWYPAHFGSELAAAFREIQLKRSRKPCHRELILCGDCDEEPILVHITSHW